MQQTRDCRFSVVVPVWQEQERVNEMIRHMRSVAAGKRCEIIIVDGNSAGSTIEAVADSDVVTMTADKGRGSQMNAGAAAARGETVLFLHADTRLPAGAFDTIQEVLKDESIVGGAFDLGIESERLSLRCIAALARIRSRVTRVPYGDQAIFIRRAYFESIGGYDDIPLMEDVALMLRIRRKGHKICILRDRVETSPRRWEKEGVVHSTLRHIVLRNLYRFGVSPERLAGHYKDNVSKEA